MVVGSKGFSFRLSKSPPLNLTRSLRSDFTDMDRIAILVLFELRVQGIVRVQDTPCEMPNYVSTSEILAFFLALTSLFLFFLSPEALRPFFIGNLYPCDRRIDWRSIGLSLIFCFAFLLGGLNANIQSGSVQPEFLIIFVNPLSETESSVVKKVIARPGLPFLPVRPTLWI